MEGKKIVVNINELEAILQSYHNSDCWNEIINWFNQFGKNIDERAKFLKAFLYTPKPLTSVDGRGNAGDFSVLQGDIIKTKAVNLVLSLFSKRFHILRMVCFNPHNG